MPVLRKGIAAPRQSNLWDCSIAGTAALWENFRRPAGAKMGAE